MSKLLVVEDNEMNRDMLMRRLARHGYEVLAASDGIQGIEAARSGQPDLILMDMSLPEIDGWTATRQLKSDPLTRGTPVVALTAHAMPGDRAKALAAGCDAFETKPVDLARASGVLLYEVPNRGNSALDRDVPHQSTSTVLVRGMPATLPLSSTRKRSTPMG
jgi:CheY-like chemotaxis protein